MEHRGALDMKQTWRWSVYEADGAQTWEVSLRPLIGQLKGDAERRCVTHWSPCWTESWMTGGGMLNLDSLRVIGSMWACQVVIAWKEGEWAGGGMWVRRRASVFLAKLPLSFICIPVLFAFNILCKLEITTKLNVLVLPPCFRMRCLQWCILWGQ